MNKLLGSIINKFDAEAKSHMERQSLNPFSGSFSRSPSPRLSKDQYGKPLAGSKTEERGQKAKVHILREIQDLCNCIHDLGVYNKTHKPQQDSDDEEEPHGDEDEIIITFGEIFQMYTKINDKVVGLLIAAKKRGFLYFEKEILFQRRDDDVLIALIKPISEIRAIINRELAAAKSPVAFASRGGSPAVGDDSDLEKSNKSVEGSSKRGSGSPIQNKNKSSRTGTPSVVCNGTASVETNESVGQPSTEVAKENENDVVNEKTHEVEIKDLEKKDSADVPNNEIISLPPVSSEQDKNETVSKENGETETDVVQVSQPIQQNDIVEQRPIPRLEVTCDAENLVNDDTEISQEISHTSESIPTIEITKELTPERGTSEEPCTTDSNEVTVEEPKNNEIHMDKVSDVSESSQVCTETNPENTNVSVNTIEDSSVVVADENGKDNVDIPSEIVESTNIEDSVAQNINVTDVIQTPVTLLCENERKRTFSNEELIESLAAALSGRSSSPDICDEEVEQIFQSQAAVAPLLNDPSQEIHIVHGAYDEQSVSVTNPSGQDLSDEITKTGFENSDVIKIPTPETFSTPQSLEAVATPEFVTPTSLTKAATDMTAKTPENRATPEILAPKAEIINNDSATTEDNSSATVTNFETNQCSPKILESSQEIELPNPEHVENTLVTVGETEVSTDEIKVSTPDKTVETKIHTDEAIVPTQQTTTETNKSINETSLEPTSAT